MKYKVKYYAESNNCYIYFHKTGKYWTACHTMYVSSDNYFSFSTAKWLVNSNIYPDYCYLKTIEIVE